MFGTQCDYGNGAWDVWDGLHGQWVPSSVPCAKFKPNVWYHITETFYRTSDTREHYQGLTIVQYNSNMTIASSKSYTLGMVEPSGPLPTGWGENLGVQFQMDIGPAGGTLTEWVDKVTLSAN